MTLTVSAYALTPPTLSVVNAASSSPSSFAPGSLVKLIGSAPGTYDIDPNLIQITFQSQRSSQVYPAAFVANNPYFRFGYAVVPDALPPGPATVTLSVPNGSGLTAAITIAPVAPGLFTVGQNGFGPAAAQNLSASAAPSVNQLTNPAVPGGFVTLWGTGLGASKTSEVTVDIAGESIAPSFAGPSPGIPGVDQVNFQLPADAYLGCYVPVDIRVSGVVSNSATLAINATPGACAHPLGLSYSDLQTLDQGGRIRLGWITMSSQSPLPGLTQPLTISTAASANFALQDAPGVFLIAQPQAPMRPGCVVQPAGANLTIAVLISGSVDAGPLLTLSGPAGASLSIPQQGGIYSASSAAPWVPGGWQIRAPGGRDVLAFEQAFTLPAEPQLTSVSQLGPMAAGDGGIAVTWNPVGYGAGDLMTVALGNTSSTDGSFAPTIVCTDYAFEGRILAPAPLAGIVPVPDTVTLTISALNASRVTFPLPVAGGETARGVIGYTFRSVNPITPALSLRP
jgi:uncharacterized protein (TIGR03437 family)